MSDLTSSTIVPDMLYLGQSKPKVYINPNFNRQNALNNAAMHVNPKFSQLISNLQHNTSNKTKIYVNPNFIKPANNIRDISLCSSTSTKKEFSTRTIINRTTNYETELPLTTTGYKPINNVQTQLSAPITKSRYCLVRNKLTKEPPGAVAAELSNNTFKIHKYKSVPWKDIKKNLDSTISNRSIFVKKAGNGFEKHFRSQKTDSSLFKSCETVNRYKLVNHNNKLPVLNTMVRTQPFVYTNVETDIHKKTSRLNRSLNRTKKFKKGYLKKNNIPCPLFRKFGKCLRNERGNCEFLHDKKHVSVCRKFIKGICHDRACLLSHDLTQEKMPTCYFYLKGTCLKDGCPYLHVKLNENAKVCPDFIKGYCEKGSKCLYRHVNVQLQNRKGTSQFNKYSTSKIKSANVTDQVNDNKRGDIKHVVTENQNNQTALVTECRYYQDNKNDEDTNTNDILYKVIKPIRCKLGTLPSFIEL